MTVYGWAKTIPGAESVQRWAAAAGREADLILTAGSRECRFTDSFAGLEETADRADNANGGVLACADLTDREAHEMLTRSSVDGFRLVITDRIIDTGTPLGTVLADALELGDNYLRLRRSAAAAGRPVSLNPDTARKVIDLRRSGLTYQKIADLLNADRVPTSTGKGEWTVTSVRRVVLRAGPDREGG